eukprot:sb/3465533/
MAVFSEGGTSYLDILLFLYYLLILLLSITLNALVLHHNYKKHPSLPRTLFIILAISDILVCVIFSTGSAYSTWTAKISNDNITCSDTNKEIVYRDYYYMCLIDDEDYITLVMKVLTVIAFGVQAAPAIVTGVFTTIRFISIRFPLRIINKKIVLVFLGVTVPFAFVVFTVCMIDTASYQVTYIVSLNMAMPIYRSTTSARKSDSLDVGGKSGPGGGNITNTDQAGQQGKETTVEGGWKYLSKLRGHIIAVSPTLIIQLVGLVATGLTICHLLKMHYKPEVTGSNQPRSHIKGTVKLLIMNFGSLLSFILFITVILKGNDSKNAQTGLHEEYELSIIFQFFTFQILPSLTSTLNPILYIAFTNDAVLPECLTGWCKKKRSPRTGVALATL